MAQHVVVASRRNAVFRCPESGQPRSALHPPISISHDTRQYSAPYPVEYLQQGVTESDQSREFIKPFADWKIPGIFQLEIHCDLLKLP